MRLTDRDDSRDGTLDDFVASAPSAAVAMELAETLDRDVTDIEPLGNVIDTDALNRLFTNSQSQDFTFEFTHAGCEISVSRAEVTVSKQG